LGTLERILGDKDFAKGYAHCIERFEQYLHTGRQSMGNGEAKRLNNMGRL
jgi:hypothetical protein